MGNYLKVLDILGEMQLKGIDLFVEDEKLKMKVKEGQSVSEDLLNKVKENKPLLLKFLLDPDNTFAVKKLNNSHSENLAFLLPGMPGFVDNYDDLGISLESKFKVYGIPFVRGVSTSPLKSVRETTTYTLDQIRGCIDKGQHFQIIAHSYGAYVAYEISKILISEDYKLDCIIFIDVACPSFRKKSCNDSYRLHESISYFIEEYNLIKTQKHKWAPELFGVIEETSKDQLPDSIIHFVNGYSKMQMSSFNANVLRSFVYQLLMTFDINGSLKTRLILVKAADVDWSKFPPGLGWEEIFSDLRIISLQGNHYTVIQHSNILPLCEAL
ncbi:thioesterase domain-containing protein [Fulvivirga maritima]|uniref:thioesterase domain-containing protein n=1 Tax=Fulvivirga maritima TaxID=2904247 RepID=UPI001F476C1F|nr:thioesterase domain-containing protein [Fulvivirga maritima]UII27568.1 thioesterase domain-containing protein [Fulvivirga maritima]